MAEVIFQNHKLHIASNNKILVRNSKWWPAHFRLTAPQRSWWAAHTSLRLDDKLSLKKMEPLNRMLSTRGCFFWAIERALVIRYYTHHDTQWWERPRYVPLPHLWCVLSRKIAPVFTPKTSTFAFTGSKTGDLWGIHPPPLENLLQMVQYITSECQMIHIKSFWSLLSFFQRRFCHHYKRQKSIILLLKTGIIIWRHNEISSLL